MASTTLTVRLSRDVKNNLGQLARRTKRTRSYLAGEAIAAFVARELEIVEGIHRSLEDVRAGRVVPHDEVMRGINAIITAAAKKKKRR